ncbi:hypothetical protein ACFUJY_30155 [Streptomyces sp. NPDC057249]|uniref:scabin-related ADP-ribosyltransferase n=1 Tax=Streptomyces sp. NPDC057249 TaxID=3346067 RepID=UPI0036371AA1
MFTAKSALHRRSVGALVAAAAAVSVLAPAQARAVGAPAQVRAPEPAAAQDWYGQWVDTTADPGTPVRETRPRLTWRTDHDVLWRGANRDPAVVFGKGLWPSAENKPAKDWQYNWVGWVTTAQSNSVFSGTSRDHGQASEFGTWVYEIHAPWGIDQEASGTYLANFGTNRNEKEVSFPGGIKSRFIKRACKKDDPSDCRDNPNYAPTDDLVTPQDVAVMPIDWERLWPTQHAEDLPWFSGDIGTWAVGSAVLNPFQGADAFRHGLRQRAGAAWPWIGLFTAHVVNSAMPTGWEKRAAGSGVPAFPDVATAQALVAKADDGGWIYRVSSRAHGFRADVLEKATKDPVPARPGEISYVGGVRGDLLLEACHYPRHSTTPDQCVPNLDAAADTPRSAVLAP